MQHESGGIFVGGKAAEVEAEGNAVGADEGSNMLAGTAGTGAGFKVQRCSLVGGGIIVAPCCSESRRSPRCHRSPPLKMYRNARPWNHSSEQTRPCQPYCEATLAEIVHEGRRDEAGTLDGVEEGAEQPANIQKDTLMKSRKRKELGEA